MKKCPLCTMIVDGEYECPICQTTLTYEPEIPDCQCEELVFNQYLVIHLAKNMWFSLLCVIISVVELILLKPDIIPLLVAAIILLGLSLFFSLFQRRIILWVQWKYSEQAARWYVLWVKYVFGALGVLVALCCAIPS